MSPFNSKLTQKDLVFDILNMKKLSILDFARVESGHMQPSDFKYKHSAGTFPLFSLVKMFYVILLKMAHTDNHIINSVPPSSKYIWEISKTLKLFAK